MTVRRKKSRKSARKGRSRKPARLKPKRWAKRKQPKRRQPKRAAPRSPRASALASLPASVRAWLRRGRKVTGRGPTVKTRTKAVPEPKCPFCEEDHGLDGHPFERWDEYVADRPVRSSRTGSRAKFLMPPELRFRDEYPEEGD